MAKPKAEKEVRKLECKVSKAEIDERKDRLVNCDNEINEAIAVKREETAEHNKKIKALQEEQENLLMAVRRGVELREVDCFWKQNDRLHKKELIRADTGKVVDETAQTLADKQEDLFDANEKRVEGGKPWESDKPTKIKGTSKGRKHVPAEALK